MILKLTYKTFSASCNLKTSVKSSLIGHSYGGMVATGVADRAPDRIAQLIYLDAFVPSHGQTLIDLLPSDERQRLLDSIRTGDGWRVTPNPIPPDTTSEDAEWIAKFRMPQSAKCFEQPLYLPDCHQLAPRIHSLHQVCGQEALCSVREPCQSRGRMGELRA